MAIKNLKNEWKDAFNDALNECIGNLYVFFDDTEKKHVVMKAGQGGTQYDELEEGPFISEEKAKNYIVSRLIRARKQPTFKKEAASKANEYIRYQKSLGVVFE